MKNKNPEIPRLERTDLMSFLETQASGLEEAEKRREHEANLKDLSWREEESRKGEEVKLAQLETELDKL